MNTLPLYLSIFLGIVLCDQTYDISNQNNESTLTSYLLSKSYKDVKSSFKVVIDAGHGGKDPGTMGSKSKEKDVALAIALATGELIEQNHPNVDVIYTRKDDTFIPLFERIGIANDHQADLFLSIHCNASANNQAKGTETYVMGLHTAEENLETAKRENQSILMESDFEANYEGFDPESDAGHIILSMYQNLYLDKSIEFANLIENSMDIRSSRGVKQAGFVVLRKATMPSVLIETGFLSNRGDEKKLTSSSGQLKIAQAIAKAFSAFYKFKVPEISTISPTGKKETETFYTIQLAAMKKPKSVSSFRGMESVFSREMNGIHKYFYGRFADRSTAMLAVNKVTSEGYKDAFIVQLDQED